jgi:hypothetical protein
LIAGHQQSFFGVRRTLNRILKCFPEAHGGRRVSISLEPAHCSIAHNGKQQGLCVLAAEALKGGECPQKCLLNDVFCIMAAARQPFGEIVRRLKKRGNPLLEAT